MRDSNENCQKAGDRPVEAGRIISILIAVVCLVVAYFFGRSDAFHFAVTIIVLPLGCIWYGNEIGSFAGMSSDAEGEDGNIMGMLIMGAGWVVLFGMLAVTFFSAFGNSQ